MQTVRSFLKPWAWLAIVAVLGAALLPTLAHAVMAAKGGAQSTLWVEVCSASGSRWVAVSDADATNKPTGGVAMDMAHCPLCCLQNNLPALPARAAAPLVLALGVQALPRLWLQAPEPLFVWASPLSRGPPVVA